MVDFSLFWVMFTLCNSLIDQILLNAEIVDDKALTVGGILTHIELQHIADRIVLGQAHLIQAHLLADKVLKLIRRNLTKTFESCNLG